MEIARESDAGSSARVKRGCGERIGDGDGVSTGGEETSWWKWLVQEGSRVRACLSSFGPYEWSRIIEREDEVATAVPRLFDNAVASFTTRVGN